MADNLVVARVKGTDSLLRTKLHRPPLPVDLVEREEIVELLDRERTRPLTLVSAPAGYGKSVLVASWLEHCDWVSTWLSLDVDDGDLRVFLTYVVFAMREIVPGVCEQSLALTKAADLPSLDTVAAVLGNELDAIDEPFVLVLDDYHRIDAASPVHELLEKLLAHPPIPLHIILVSRLDPPLSLVRQRALGQLTDVRVLDLRLSTSETRSLLRTNLNCDASNAALANLDRQLEGWVVGLKLVALALRNSSDPEDLLLRFRGGTREMQSYLVGEVLATLPEHVRDCLTKAALLDRFCASLCDAVCGTSDEQNSGDHGGKEFLHSVYNANLFLIPLDGRGEWFRFHHLFQELLQRELFASLSTQEINALHMTASQWFEHRDLIDEAIRHALAAGDELAAVEIIERHRHAQLNADNWYVIERWLKMLPASVETRPNLLLARAWIAYERFQIEALPAILDRVAIHVDEQAKETALWGELRLLQGEVFYWSGNGQQAHTCFAEARLRLSEDLPLYAGLLELQDALSLHMCGQTKQAIEALNRRVREAFNKQGVYFSRLVAGLFFAHLMSGDLHHARSSAVHLESVATAGNIEYTKAWSSYMRACTYLHRHELEQAARHFEVAVEQRYILHRIAAVESLAGLALCRQLLGRQGDAEKTIQDLLDFARELGDPVYVDIAQSCRARCDVLRGDATNALVWAGGTSAPPEFAEMFMWMEVPALTRARVQIALGSDESLNLANDLLEKSIERMRKWNLVNQSIEAHALRSLALDKLGREQEASHCLDETLALAAPGGWVRPFLELGPPMAALMARAEQRIGATDFSQHVLSLFNSEPASRSIPTAPRSLTMNSDGAIREPLTNREVAILELLAQRLQNKEIATRLFVSPETVKSHLKRIFQKLDVHNRRDAAAIARQILATHSRIAQDTDN